MHQLNIIDSAYLGAFGSFILLVEEVEEEISGNGGEVRYRRVVDKK